MQKKMLLISILIVLGMLLGACAGAATPVASQPALRTLNVNGSAQVSLDPDIAYISIGVHSENADAAEAVADNNTRSTQVKEALIAMGIDAKDIRTTNFSIYPQDEYNPEGQRLGVRFVVDNTVYVTLRQLDKIGEILGAAVSAGANSIYGIQFDVADKTDALSQARASAVDSARKQAEELAKAAGVELGTIQALNFYNNYPTTVYYDNKMPAGVGGSTGSVPVSAGQLVVSADVNITYEIR